MLTHLSLKDFVIVRELNLDVQSGLTVLTGETGAGKSILIDALEMIVGAAPMWASSAKVLKART